MLLYYLFVFFIFWLHGADVDVPIKVKNELNILIPKKKHEWVEQIV